MASAPSVFDEGLQPGQCLIPLLGNEIEVLFDSRDRLRIEFESALATLTNAVHDSYSLQHSKVLGDRLPGKLRALGQLSDRSWLSPAEFSNQR